MQVLSSLAKEELALLFFRNTNKRQQEGDGDGGGEKRDKCRKKRPFTAAN